MISLQNELSTTNISPYLDYTLTLCVKKVHRGVHHLRESPAVERSLTCKQEAFTTAFFKMERGTASAFYTAPIQMATRTCSSMSGSTEHRLKAEDSQMLIHTKENLMKSTSLQAWAP